MFANMEYVYAVYKEKSFSKAADKLFITQPSLSATIKKVESRLGTQLFDRSSNPIQLTDSGREYIKCVEKIMDIQNTYQNYLNDSEELKVGTLSVGASNFYASYILPPLITRFQGKYPRVRIDLVEATTAQLEKRLFSGDVDLIIDNYDFDETVYAKHYFFSETLVLAVHQKHLTAEMEPYRLSAAEVGEGKHLVESTPAPPLELFGRVPFVTLRYGNDTRDRGEHIFAQSGFHPEIVLELDQMATAYRVACSGMGAALTSDTLVKETVPDLRVAFFKVGDAHAKRDTFFYYKQTKYVTRPMEEFLKMAAYRTGAGRLPKQ